MLITGELLKQYDACESGIKYIERFYPQGAEMIDIIRDRHIAKDFLHWGREHLAHSTEELKAYCESCSIVNSNDFWYSTNIENSRFIVKSKEIKNSERVFYSSDVENSLDIVHGETVEDSAQIFSSSLVSDSKMIAHCNNVSQSKNICFSTMIMNSVNIRESKSVFDSSEIINGVNVSDSYFCSNCENIRHCMFCDGIKDVEYYLFNQPTTKERFEFFVRQYKKFMNTLLCFTPEWPSDITATCAPALTLRPDFWYEPISDKFWKWARTLPNFDSMFVYKMTMLKKILLDEF